MVAEPLAQATVSDRSMEGTSMATGQLVYFPGWDVLQARGCEELDPQQRARHAHGRYS